MKDNLGIKSFIVRSNIKEWLDQALIIIFIILLIIVSGLPFGGNELIVEGAPDIATLRPDADGHTVAWSIYDTTHYGSTSDQSNTTYIYTTTDGQSEFLNLDPPTFGDSDTINSIQTHYTCQAINGGGGPEKLDLYIRSDTTDTETNANKAVSRGSWGDLHGTVQTTNPVTDSAWTKSEVAALQIGMIVDSIGGGETIQCSELWVTVDYTPVTVSLTVADQSIDYLTIGVGTSEDTTATGVDDTQTATNNGDVTEDFNIKGQNSASWTLKSSAGNEEYVHEFSTTGGAPWTALTTTYQTLATSISTSGTQTFDLRVTVPSSTSDYTSQSVNVMVQAVESP